MMTEDIAEDIIELTDVIPCHTEAQGNRDTENYGIEDITSERYITLSYKGQSKRLNIGSEFDDEYREEKVRVYQDIQLREKVRMLLGIFFLDVLEELCSESSDGKIEEISADISSESEQENQREAEYSKRSEKGGDEGDDRSLENHEPEHQNISSSLKLVYGCGIEIGGEVHRIRF